MAEWDIPNPFPGTGARSPDTVFLAVGKALSHWELVEQALAGLYVFMTTGHLLDWASPGTGLKYMPPGVVYDCDPPEVNASTKRRKPWRYFIDRRVDFPFKENLFLCQAPIGTPEFTVMLQALEQALADNRM
jgi:hypothetical protein